MDERDSQIGYFDAARAQVVADLETFRDEIDAQRNADVVAAKGRPHIVDSTVILRAPGIILTGGGIGTGGSSPEETPPQCCPAATLVCDQISASLYKCGFIPFTGADGTYYLTEVSRFVDGCCDCGPGTPPCTGTICFEADGTTTWIINPVTCAPMGSGGWDCEGCGHGHQSGSAGYSIGEGAHPRTPPIVGGSITEDTTTPTFIRRTLNASTRCDGSTHDPYTEATRSTIYTTALLIANTEAALPAYDDDFDDSCEAYRNLSEDESSYSITRVRYKFTFAEPLEQECTIRWIERTFDEDGNPVEDNAMSELVLEGETETTVYEIMEPAENGTVSIIYPIGPCCTEGVCSVTDEETCTDGGGEFMGECCIEESGDCCDPDPCAE